MYIVANKSLRALSLLHTKVLTDASRDCFLGALDLQAYPSRLLKKAFSCGVIYWCLILSRIRSCARRLTWCNIRRVGSQNNFHRPAENIPSHVLVPACRCGYVLIRTRVVHYNTSRKRKQHRKHTPARHHRRRRHHHRTIAPLSLDAP